MSAHTWDLETAVRVVLDDCARKIAAECRVAGKVPPGIHEHPAMKGIDAMSALYPAEYERWAAR